MTGIAVNAFTGCTRLETVLVPYGNLRFDSDSFIYSVDTLGEIPYRLKIYCPAGSETWNSCCYTCGITCWPIEEAPAGAPFEAE